MVSSVGRLPRGKQPAGIAAPKNLGIDVFRFARPWSYGGVAVAAAARRCCVCAVMFCFHVGTKSIFFCTLCLSIVCSFSSVCYIFLVYMSGVHRTAVANGVQTDLFWAKSGLFGPKLGRRQVTRPTGENHCASMSANQKDIAN